VALLPLARPNGFAACVFAQIANPLFHFPLLLQNHFFNFAARRENEYRQKHSGPARGNGVAGIWEVSKGGLGGLPLAHDFARQSLVCYYTFCDR